MEFGRPMLRVDRANLLLTCLRCCACSVLILLCALPATGLAQQSGINRILVLHGVWDPDDWEYEFNAAFSELMSQSDTASIEISVQFLGLDSSTSDATLSSLTTFVQNSIVERGVDLIVSVLPLAGDFLFSLQTPPGVAKLYVLPSETTAVLARNVQNAPVVTSASLLAIRNTLTQILILKPETTTVVAIGGSNSTDMTYFEYLREIMPEFTDRLDFELQSGQSPEVLEQLVAQLDQTSVVLDLPYESYTTASGQLASVSREQLLRILAASTVPVFGVFENELGTGLTGGFLTSAKMYADTTANQVLARIATGNWLQPSGAGAGQTKYDWEQAQRFNLDMDQLIDPFEWVNRPAPIWETNLTLVVVVLNVLILLLFILLFLATLLRRSNRMHAEVSRAERQARESESKFRLLATSTIDVIWTWNSNHRSIQYCSPSVEQLTGFTPEQFSSRKLSQLMTPESVQACEEMLADSSQNGQILEVQHYTKSGQIIWCEMSVKQVHADDGDNIVVIVTRDISQRIAAEAERRKLADMVRQNQKFESLGTLAGGIAHDFNNVLAVIVGTTDMLYLENKGNAEAMELLDTLRASSQRATALINQILTFSRQSDGKKKVVKLKQLINHAITFLNKAKPANIQIVTTITRNELLVFADHTQIEQVVFNLVTNSMQAIEGDSGKIRLSLDNCAVSQPLRCTQGEVAPGYYALLEVADDGIGMDDEKLDQIFDPFYTSKDLGNGMGLAITRSIVINHGGAIDVVSRPGEGSLFRIYLPLTDHESEEEIVKPENTSALGQKRIVVIDDNEATLKVLCQMFVRLGHDCTGISDPAQALQLIEREHESIDLVVTDYSMPNIDGLQIVKYCAGKFADIPVIICSGFGELSLQNNDPGVPKSVRTMQKPFSLNVLSQMLDEVFA